jgi:O-antigen/teichoic acid export membrane protein
MPSTIATVAMVGIVAGLLGLLVLLLYLTYKVPGRNKRGNWSLRMVGVAVGLAMMGAGVFLTKYGELPMATVGASMFGIGSLVAFLSVAITTQASPAAA